MSDETMTELEKTINELRAQRDDIEERYMAALSGAMVALSDYGRDEQPSGWENVCLAICCRAVQQVMARELDIQLKYGTTKMSPFEDDDSRNRLRRPSILEMTRYPGF